MKHLKIYESYNAPDLGDYAICDIYPGGGFEPFKDLKDFLSNNIGIIIRYPIYKDDNYIISYNNLPKSLELYLTTTKNDKGFEISRDEIKYYSKDKNKLETILQANKFNL